MARPHCSSTQGLFLLFTQEHETEHYLAKVAGHDTTGDEENHPDNKEKHPKTDVATAIGLPLSVFLVNFIGSRFHCVGISTQKIPIFVHVGNKGRIFDNVFPVKVFDTIHDKFATEIDEHGVTDG